jgi:hypothetical protein
MKLPELRGHVIRRKPDRAWRTQDTAVTVLHNTMKTYGGMEVQLHAFLTPALDGGEWLTSCSDREVGACFSGFSTKMYTFLIAPMRATFPHPSHLLLALLGTVIFIYLKIHIKTSFEIVQSRGNSNLRTNNPNCKKWFESKTGIKVMFWRRLSNGKVRCVYLQDTHILLRSKDLLTHELSTREIGTGGNESTQPTCESGCLHLTKGMKSCTGQKNCMKHLIRTST